MADVREVFGRRGLRCTRQRELVYEALASTHTHPTAEELFHLVRAVEPGISLATVYNTLEVFTGCGLCAKIPSAQGNGPSRFDVHTHDHVHLVTRDGRVLDVPEDLSRLLLSRVPTEAVQRIESRMGVRVKGVSLRLEAELGRDDPQDR